MAAIFDVDGTLCNVESIRHYVTAKPKNFEAFHAGSVNCPPHEWVAESARAIHGSGMPVLVVTARKERYWWHTTLWLRENWIPYHALFMRGDNDGRPDYEVKADILAEIRRFYSPVIAFDDNPAVLRLWREEGIPAVRVPGWIEGQDHTCRMRGNDPQCDICGTILT
jgi:hypothetical protein